MEFKKEFIYKNLNKDEKIIFKEFQAPIFDFINDLDQKNLLKLEYGSEVEKFLYFFKSLDALSSFYNTLIDNKNVLNNVDLNLNDLPYLGAHVYQIISEKLKLSFLFFIKVEEMKIGKNPSFGRMINKFRDCYPKNKFISELNYQNRNSVAHYSYYFKGSSICLCENYLDENPRCIEYKKFEQDIKKLNIIEELFIATDIDDFLAKWTNKI